MQAASTFEKVFQTLAMDTNPDSKEISTTALSIHKLYFNGEGVPEMKDIVIKSRDAAYLAISQPMNPNQRQDLQGTLEDIRTCLANAKSRDSRVSRIFGRWRDGPQLKKHKKFLHNFILQGFSRQQPRNRVPEKLKPQPSVESLADWVSDVDVRILDSQIATDHASTLSGDEHLTDESLYSDTTHESLPSHSSSESATLASCDQIKCPPSIPVIIVSEAPSDTDSSQSTADCKSTAEVGVTMRARPRRVLPTERDNKGRLSLIIAPLEDYSNAEAKELADVVQSEIQTTSSADIGYRNKCTKYLRRLFEKHRVLPSSLYVNDVVRPEGNSHPSCGGGFSDIYKGIRRGEDVCLKVLRLFPADDCDRKEKTINELCKEALIWTQLSHSNVLPFFGVNNELFPHHGFCMVAPWMKNGGVNTFLQKNPGHDRLVVCREIAAGMTYLHSRGVAHSDIKPPNILVDENGHCRLADFGLAATVHEATSFNATTATGSQKGTTRYMAPEIMLMGDSTLVPNGCPSKIDKFAADVYSYACTVFEIMTGKPPFPTLNDAAVMLRVATLHARPERPRTEAGIWCPDNVWGLLEECWNRKPERRPLAENILRFLEYIEELRHLGEPWDQIPYSD